MYPRPVTLVAAFLFASPLLAQTYHPKAIHVQGAETLDQKEVMRLVALPSGEPITKEDIDQALERLGASGFFTEIRYSVTPDALTIIVKTSPGAHALPVRFANFVWWKPGELEALVQARVPQFKGSLPLAGDLTDKVEAALTSLLAENGIQNAHVTARLSSYAKDPDTPSSEIQTVTFALEQPQITLRNLDLNGVAPEAKSPMTFAIIRLKSDEFDLLLTSRAIVETTAEVHRNVGYLDATVKDPFFSEPVKQTVGYGVDASAVVYPGILYHVSAVTFAGVPPDMIDQLTSAVGIKPGDPAGALALRSGQGSAARFFINRGMLDGTASVAVARDTTAHTASYRFEVSPGPVYHFAALNISALTPVQQKVFLLRFAIKTGSVADQSVTAAITQSLLSAGLSGAVLLEKKNRANHTVTYTVQPQSASTQ